MRRMFHCAAVVAALGMALFCTHPAFAAYPAFNVTDFGARCDGIAAHDDTVAIQAAIVAAESISTTGNPAGVAGQVGKVELPAGQTCIYSTLRIDQAVVLESSGSKQAFLTVHVQN